MITMDEVAAARRREDAELARRCVAGDELARTALFDAHRGRVHHVLYRVLGHNRDMDDAIQDAFIAIFRSLPSYRGEATLGTWIDRVTVRVALHCVRRRKRDAPRALEVVGVEDPARGPDRRAEAREAARRLYAILDEVEPTHRAAFALHAIDGLPLREVASLMEASLIATKLRVWRTRQRVEQAARADELLRDYVLDGGAS